MKHNKTLIFGAFAIIVTTLLSSCNNKTKVQKLIEKQLFSEGYGHSGYQVIETKPLDSAFTSIYTDVLMRNYAQQIIEHIDKIKKYQRIVEEEEKKIKSAPTVMQEKGLQTIYTSAFEIRDIHFRLKQRAEEIKNEFIGWETKHTFQIKDADGETVIMEHHYIIDEDIQKIIFKENLNSNEQKTIKDIIYHAVYTPNSEFHKFKDKLIDEK